MDSVVEVFADGNCAGGHVHLAIAGAEGGMKRSQHAQYYPPGLCKALAEACEIYLRNLTLDTASDMQGSASCWGCELLCGGPQCQKQKQDIVTTIAVRSH